MSALLRDLKYRLQATRKTTEGASTRTATRSSRTSAPRCTFQERGQPVVSIDAKKKELVGDFKNGGREWQPEGQPEPVRVHDFPDKTSGKLRPTGCST